MNTNTAKPLDLAPAPDEADAPLETWLDEVSADAHRDPEAYLRETRVPEGGE